MYRYIADGCVPHTRFCDIARGRQSKAASRAASPTAAALAVAEHGHKASLTSSKASASQSSATYTGQLWPVLNDNGSSHRYEPQGTSNGTSLGPRPDAASYGNSEHSSSSKNDSSSITSSSSSSSTNAGGQWDPRAGAPGGSFEEAAFACDLELPPVRRERFVFFRGVQWSAPEVNAVSGRGWAVTGGIWAVAGGIRAVAGGNGQ